MSLRRVLPAALLALAAGSAFADELPLTISARAAWVENHSRTSDGPTTKDAAAHEVSASTDFRRQLNPAWQFSGEASAGWETVPRFAGLDAWRLGVRGELRHKFGLGPFAPVVDLHAAALRSWLDEDGRSGAQLSAGVTVGKRFGAAWRVAAGAEWSRYYARHAPFDVRQIRGFLSATWDATERWQVQAGAARLDGQVTANASGPVYASALAGGFGPQIQSYYRAIPWHVTHTYGPGWVAYRVDARADQWWLGLAPALGERTSLPLRYERIDLTNKVGVRYVSEIWSLAVLHRF